MKNRVSRVRYCRDESRHRCGASANQQDCFQFLDPRSSIENRFSNRFNSLSARKSGNYRRSHRRSQTQTSHSRRGWEIRDRFSSRGRKWNSNCSRFSSNRNNRGDW